MQTVQVLWIDFHSSGAEAKACAYFCTELPSRGDLEVAFEATRSPKVCISVSGYQIILGHCGTPPVSKLKPTEVTLFL